LNAFEFIQWAVVSADQDGDAPRLSGGRAAGAVEGLAAALRAPA
jgi:hypothetical protein